jgi:hypothetical protein
MPVMRRFAALSALLLAMALLAPRLALAHGGVQHESAAYPDADRAFAVAPCPGGHGDLCTCGDPVGCSGSPTLAVAPAPLVVLALALGFDELRRESPPRARPSAFSLRYSRAPPALG